MATGAKFAPVNQPNARKRSEEVPERLEKTMSNGDGRTVRLAKEGVVRNRKSGTRRIARVFIDVDTQRDFMYPQGADYFSQAGRIAPRVARLFRFAQNQGYPVISTTMCLRSNDSVSPRPSNGCVEGTNGQKKPAFALLAKRVSFGPNGGIDLPSKILSRCQQLIFENNKLVFIHSIDRLQIPSPQIFDLGGYRVMIVI